jgi:hypothetical protein
MRLRQSLEALRSDVRLAVRQLISAPGFTAVATLTLALGIGVNSAIFSLADAALMRPLPFGDAEGLVMLWERLPTSAKTGVSPLNMRDWSRQSRSFEGIAAVQRGMGGGPLLTASDGSIETAERQSVTANFFDVLRVTPIVGRAFRSEDDSPSPRVVLLGEAVWRRRFSSDPAVVGRVVRLNGEPYTVVGVVADAVQMLRPAEIWTLSPQFPDVPQMRAARAFAGSRASIPNRTRLPASSSNRSAPASSAATCRRRRCSSWGWWASCCCSAVRTSPTCCSRGRPRGPVRSPCGLPSVPNADGS